MCQEVLRDGDDPKEQSIQSPSFTDRSTEAQKGLGDLCKADVPTCKHRKNKLLRFKGKTTALSSEKSRRLNPITWALVTVLV